MTKARIYKPAKTAMQSGKVGTRRWVLEFEPAEKKANDPIMGWAGSGDMRSQIKLKFETLAEAEDYATRKGLEFVVRQPRQAKPKYQTYADNFK
jgi:hypothetical protein